MNNDPEDPNDNPWDPRSDDTKSKRPTKKPTEESKNPWGKKDGPSLFNKKPGAFNNSDDLFSSFIKQVKDSSNKFGGGGNQRNGSGKKPPFNPVSISKIGVLGIALVGAALWLSTGFFRLEESQIAVILRFGRVVDTVGPGLHYRLPYPIESEIRKEVTVENRIDSVDKGDNLRGPEKTLALTGDENMIHINYTVFWKIKKIEDYLFSVREPDKTIFVAAESTMREVVGQTTALEALTEKRREIELKTQDLLQKILDQYNVGVQIVRIQLQKVEAPSEVINAFNDLQASLTDANRMSLEADAYHAEIVPKARGESSKIIQEAEGYEKEVIARAQGEVDRFNQVYVQYKRNPEIARKRLYLDTMEHVLSRVQKTIVDSKAAPGLVPYFHLQPGLKTEKKQGQ